MLTAQQAALAAESIVATLATVGPGGHPHAVPVWYYYDGTAFWVVTRSGAQKHRNLTRDPRCTLVIDRRERPYYALMIDCIAETSPEPAAAVRARIVPRYLDPAAAGAYSKSTADADSVALRLVPQRVLVYGTP